MSEIFTNFVSKLKTGEKTIIPIAGEIVESNGISNDGEMLREDNSTAQVHSIYITQYYANRLTGDDRYNESNFNYFDLWVEDENTNNRYYIVYNGQIVPGSSYYVEKNITLSATQSLKINVPEGLGLNDSSEIHINASAVLFVEDTED